MTTLIAVVGSESHMRHLQVRWQFLLPKHLPAVPERRGGGVPLLSPGGRCGYSRLQGRRSLPKLSFRWWLTPAFFRLPCDTCLVQGATTVFEVVGVVRGADSLG